jgi:signal transduction histidine kinase
VARRYWFDVPIALLAAVGLLDVALRRDAPDAPRSMAFAVVAVTALVMCILARRRFAFAGPVGYWVLAAAISLLDWRVIPFVTSLLVVGMAVAFLLGNLPDALRAGIGLVAVVGGSAIVVAKIPGHQVNDLVVIPLEFAISWVAGFALRDRAERAEAAELRAEQAEREKNAAARVAVAEERARIARELHDIVAHAVSVMVLQVGAVRHELPDDMVENRKALTGVERAGRTALTEMRRLLAAMRRDGDEAELTPQPGLDSLDSLLQGISRAGLPVQLHVEGEASPLPRAIELSAYRIVQEGLTNALKHSCASNADVTLHYRPVELQIEIRDNGQGGSTSDGAGHGLIGVRERVKIYGGEMAAGEAEEGGFLLSTRLPLTGERP